MILSDVTIREELAAGRIVIDPLGDQAVQPSSVDLHVDRYFRVFRNDTTPYIDPKQPRRTSPSWSRWARDGAFILHPGEFVLGSTLERVALPDDLVARFEGKSSLGPPRAADPLEPAGERDGHGARRRRAASPGPIGEVVAQAAAGLCRRVRSRHLRGRIPRDHGLVRRSRRPDLRDRAASGRRVRVTAGHNLFTLDRDGRSEEDAHGRAATRSAGRGTAADPRSGVARVTTSICSTSSPSRSTPTSSCTGPDGRSDVFADGGDVLAELLRDHGYRAHRLLRAACARLPVAPRRAGSTVCST